MLLESTVKLVTHIFQGYRKFISLTKVTLK